MHHRPRHHGAARARQNHLTSWPQRRQRQPESAWLLGSLTEGLGAAETWATAPSALAPALLVLAARQLRLPERRREFA
ncbi:hypothetical protein [Amycolatopsis sp. FDAARGOS 1241]|uniref:hypothetical protein n=1 Tax=Amycolatopsis sp. FDAARGOS 1241 TaxID=2778070 RepID=UPI00194EB570|nr:hypothetical protein [Amycolatopsis sp. FDAARGOS 1241]QRP46919.1 hypothetical protein I6J71_02375 [Amycolatopsis sp. FDAARGOS 1241]